MALLKAEDVAEELGIGREEVIRRCRKDWPHTRVGKHYRFTPEQLEEIKKLCEVKPQPAPLTNPEKWGLKTRSSRYR